MLQKPARNIKEELQSENVVVKKPKNFAHKPHPPGKIYMCVGLNICEFTLNYILLGACTPQCLFYLPLDNMTISSKNTADAKRIPFTKDEKGLAWHWVHNT